MSATFPLIHDFPLPITIIQNLENGAKQPNETNGTAFEYQRPLVALVEERGNGKGKRISRVPLLALIGRKKAFL